MKRVYFPDHIGRTLCGYLDEPGGERVHKKSRANKNDRAVIMLHGFMGDKSEGGFFDKIAAEIRKNGLAVLRFDFSGCGESGDAAICVKDQVTDTVAALDYMMAKGYRSFGLLGFSLGGLVALKTKDPSINARVLLAPLTKSMNVPINYSIWEQLSLVVIGKGKRVKPERKWKKEMYVSRRLFFEARTINQRKICEAIESPVLVIHGNRDSRVPLEFSKSLMGHLPKNSRLEIIKGEDHHFEKAVPKVAKLSAEWFSKNL